VKRLTPPFRADHVGSLLRPKSLLRARDSHKRGEPSASQLRAAEDMQFARSCACRRIWVCRRSLTGSSAAVAGTWIFYTRSVGSPGFRTVSKFNFTTPQGDIEFTPAALRVTGRLQLQDCIFGEDFRFLKSITRAAPKLTIPSPSMMHHRGGKSVIDSSVYPDIKEFWRELAQTYAHELTSVSCWAG
jgi:5-methyltetrahydropteroyltriglutamate--homocysteine methyltransferase